MRRVSIHGHWYGQGQRLNHRKMPFPRNAQQLRPEIRATRSIVMWDVVMLVLGFGLFVAGIGYAYACERL
jgi:hypothetical protein